MGLGKGTTDQFTGGAGGGGIITDIEDGAGDSVMDAANDAIRVNIIAGAGAGGTSMVDDAVFTPAATAGTPMIAFADEVGPDSVDEGDGGVVRMSLNRNLNVRIRDDAGNERGLNIAADNTLGINDSGNSISVDDGGAALSVDDNGGSLTVDDGGVTLSVDDGGGSLTVDNPILSVVGGGAEATAQRVTIANDSTGLLSVDDNGGSLTVDNAALAVVGGGVEAAALRVTIANDSTGLLSVDDNGGALSVDDNGGSLTVDNATISVVGGGAEATAQRVTIANDSTGVLSVDDNAGSLTVDNPVLSVVGGGAEATAQRVTIANDSTGVVTVDNAILSVVGGGAEATAQRVTIANDSTGVLTVDDGGGTLTVDNAALSVVGGGAEATALRVTLANDSTGLVSVDDNGASLTVDAAGDIADDAIDSGNPVKIGGVAVETDDTDPGAVAEGDRAHFRTDLNRRLLVNDRHPQGFSTNNNWAAAQTDTQIQAPPGAGNHLYITDVTMSAEAACNIKLVRNTAASTDIFGPFYFAANGGMVKKFKTPIRLPANENLGVTSSVAVNHTVSVQGYIAP